MEFFKKFGFTMLCAACALVFGGFGAWLFMLGQPIGALATFAVSGGFGFMVFRDVQTKLLNK